MKKKYCHAFDIAFELESDNEGEDVTADEMLTALLKRVNYLSQHPDTLVEACGLPFNTYMNELDEEAET